MSKNLCIIPARSGSKRLKGKNVKDFFGKPVIAYAIETAVKSKLFDSVFVSTDSTAIADLAAEYGADAGFLRSELNSSDHATTIDVLKEVVGVFDSLGVHFARVLCLYPVSPLVKKDDLIAGLKLLDEKRHMVAFPIVKYEHPIWRSLEFNGATSRRIWNEYVNSRTQDLSESYHDAGQWYWMNAESVRAGYDFSNLEISNVIISALRVQDVDTEEDWELLCLKYRRGKEML